VLAAGLISVNLFLVLPTLTGFEMSLALLFLLWGICQWQNDRPVWRAPGNHNLEFNMR
jgi:hypothetical protein